MTALMGLGARLSLARVQLVTDTRGGGRAFGELCGQLFLAGVDMLTVREPGLPTDKLVAALEAARSAALQLNKLVVVSEDVAAAAEFGADVLQLDGNGDAAKAKAAQHPYALVGKATHDEAGLTAAVADEAVSYVTVGPVFGSGNPRFPLPGLDFVRLAAERLPVADIAAKPWFAIGGVDRTTLDQVIEAGARRVVITRAAIGNDDPAEVARAVSDRLRTVWNSDPELESYTFRAFSLGENATFKA